MLVLSGRQYWSSVGCAPQTVAAQKWSLFLICYGTGIHADAALGTTACQQGTDAAEQSLDSTAFPPSSPVLAGNRLTNAERIVKCPGRLC